MALRGRHRTNLRRLPKSCSESIVDYVLIREDTCVLLRRFMSTMNGRLFPRKAPERDVRAVHWFFFVVSRLLDLKREDRSERSR